MDITDFTWRPLYLILRFLLWLAWDFLVLIVAWGTGWPVWRVLTLGRFPQAGFGDYEEADTLEAILVCSVGLAILGGALWLSYTKLHGS